MRLASAPTGAVSVSVGRSGGDPSLAVQSGAIRTFKASNWSAWQPVTLAQAADDGNAAGETATFQVAAAGYDARQVAAVALDDDVGENLALASGGATIAGWKAGQVAQVIDGVHAASANGGFTIWTNVPAGTMTLDLNGTMTVSRVRLLAWDWGYRVNRYRIESSTDGADWSPLADASAADHQGWDDWPVADQPIRYLRFTGLSCSTGSYVNVSELEVYGARPAGRKSLLAAAASAPVSVLTSAGPEDETGWNAVDGDAETAWTGRAPGGGYLVVEYAPALTLQALAVDLAEGSPSSVDCLYSQDAEQWLPLPEGLATNPVTLHYLWLLFPDDGTETVPRVREIRPNP